MTKSAGAQPMEDVAPWEPGRVLRRADGETVRLSRGFFRCRPERWFPGFGGQWTPLLRSMGIDARVTEVKTHPASPRTFDYGFAGSVDGEPFAVRMDAQSAQVLVEAFSPGALDVAREVVLEYLARRCIASLGISWSGPESSVVHFEPHLDHASVREAGAVKLAAVLNGSSFSAWIVLERGIVDRLDGLWRRQLRSTSRKTPESQELRVEIGQLSVPRGLIGDYTRTGAVIDLESPISDSVLLRLGDRPWVSARMMDNGGVLVCEVQAGAPMVQPPPEGTVRFSIEFGSRSIDGGTIAESGQPGAVIETDIPVTTPVSIRVGSEVVGRASLCSYQGRFAITVL